MPVESLNWRTRKTARLQIAATYNEADNGAHYVFQILCCIAQLILNSGFLISVGPACRVSLATYALKLRWCDLRARTPLQCGTSTMWNCAQR